MIQEDYLEAYSAVMGRYFSILRRAHGASIQNMIVETGLSRSTIGLTVSLDYPPRHALKLRTMLGLCEFFGITLLSLISMSEEAMSLYTSEDDWDDINIYRIEDHCLAVLKKHYPDLPID